ncbi:MAG: hypothetical protein EH225_02250 [Calditrichaeota bacterium]|nr:FAD/NAD(P)-binding protein [Calditrichota bacterium]RQW07250.1 MAG: hypothetical protein EH225_02250 [Calditrichota bacterium]
MKNIAIIGAGLSGTLLAMNLLKNSSSDPVHIKLIDRNKEQDLGPAYSTNEDYLLNVPVEIMGALSNDPEHFLKWARKEGVNASHGDYLPRKLYRKYIRKMYQEAYSEKHENKSMERFCGEVTDLKINGNQAIISVKRNGNITADKVVLASGNSLPKNPKTENGLFIKNKRYIQNPWKPNIFRDLEETDSIIFIGTGQTMVDLATGLSRKKHKGNMMAISRRGLLPLSQKKVEPYPPFFDELQRHSRILPIFQIIRKHMEIASENGLDPRAVIDSLRPHSTAIWMNLLEIEKQRFLRHLYRHWEIIRSRIPPSSASIIRDLQVSGQLKIVAGRIIDLLPDGNGMIMRYLEKNLTFEKSDSARMIINCVGPNLDYEQIDHPLIKNLMGRKLIQSNPVQLGINALPDGSVITKNGIPSKILYTIGVPLRGILWESIAAPEIRLQAENLARKLLTD